MGFIQKALLIILAIFLVVCSSSSQTLAQSLNHNSQGLNIEISPLPIVLTAKPATSTSTDLRIRNSGTANETLKVSLKTFSAEGPDGHVVLKEPTPNDTFIKWVSFSKQEFNAPPGQWQTVKMNIALPPEAAFGYYYAVQFELANPPKSQPGTARLQGAVAIFVLLNADAPGSSRKIDVTSFKADHNSYEFLPVKFSVQVRNIGNVHTAPHGNIFIKRGNSQIASLPVNSTESMVLPKSSRIFNTSWQDGFPVYTIAKDDTGQPIKDAHGHTKQKLSWDFSKVSKLRFGHYTAQLFLIYNDGQRDIPITGSLSFWIIPWRLVFVILIAILGPALIVYFVMRRRYQKRLALERKKRKYAP